MFLPAVILVQWTYDYGWHDPTLVPFGPLPIYPSSNVLQYSTSCFEGMKLYRSGTDCMYQNLHPFVSFHHPCARHGRLSQRLAA